MSVIIYKTKNYNRGSVQSVEKIQWRDEFGHDHIEKNPNHIYGIYLVSNDENVEEQWYDSEHWRNQCFKIQGEYIKQLQGEKV